MSSTPQLYKSASNFRHALEDRLKIISQQQKTPLDRLRRRVAFDRFLARFFIDANPPWLLKGGYALEFRLHNIARVTKDIDFSIPEMTDPTQEKIRDLLQQYAAKDPGDWFTFLIGIPMKELDQAVYGGWRYPIEALLDNRVFTKFHLDVGIGDAVISKPEWQTGSEFLSFAGIKPAYVAMLPREQQFAEKIHAYSYPRKGPSSRTRDLVDMVLLIEHGMPKKELVRKAIGATFERRKTHLPPTKLQIPPERWRETYQEMAEDCGVSKKNIEDAFGLVDAYWVELFK